jgi:hypothetical protein
MNYLALMVLCTALDSTTAKSQKFIKPHQMIAEQFCVNDDCKELKVWMSIYDQALYIRKDKKTITIPIVEEKHCNGFHTFKFANHTGLIRFNDNEEQAIMIFNGDYIQFKITYSTFNK